MCHRKRFLGSQQEQSEKIAYKLIYYIDTSVLLENAPLIKFIRNYIWDSHFPYAH